MDLSYSLTTFSSPFSETLIIISELSVAYRSSALIGLRIQFDVPSQRAFEYQEHLHSNMRLGTTRHSLQQIGSERKYKYFTVESATAKGMISEITSLE